MIFGMRNASECGMRNASECGMRNAECGMGNVEEATQGNASGSGGPLFQGVESRARVTHNVVIVRDPRALARRFARL